MSQKKFRMQNAEKKMSKKNVECKMPKKKIPKKNVECKIPKKNVEKMTCVYQGVAFFPKNLKFKWPDAKYWRIDALITNMRSKFEKKYFKTFPI